MKTIKSIVLALTLLVGTTVAAHTNPATSKKKDTTVTQEIGNLLKNPSFKILDEVSTTASFIINEEGEMVVLSVSTDNTKIEKYVKSRLNYQKLQSKLKKGMEYKVPIRIVSS